MMKKIFAFLLIFIILTFSSVVSFSQEPLTTSDFNLFINIPDNLQKFEPCTLRFNLFTENGSWISNQSIKVSEPGIVKVTFPIREYEIGLNFKLVATEGIESYDFYGNVFSLGEECIMETYAYRDANDEMVICNEGYIEAIPITATRKYSLENHVNTLSIWSDTPYLVWVSKANYAVNVFLKQNDRWNLIKEFTCSIGAPSTPTITGQYVYHQYQSRWQYDGYYVGPIMRFYRGYALHSTLIYNNNTDKDARVGKQISHGCVRLRPDDINWLAYYIPIGTKIYLTEE